LCLAVRAVGREVRAVKDRGTSKAARNMGTNAIRSRNEGGFARDKATLRELGSLADNFKAHGMPRELGKAAGASSAGWVPAD
jgi:hypothetical protein